MLCKTCAFSRSGSRMQPVHSPSTGCCCLVNRDYACVALFCRSIDRLPVIGNDETLPPRPNSHDLLFSSRSYVCMIRTYSDLNGLYSGRLSDWLSNLHSSLHFDIENHQLCCEECLTAPLAMIQVVTGAEKLSRQETFSSRLFFIAADTVTTDLPQRKAPFSPSVVEFLHVVGVGFSLSDTRVNVTRK